MDDLHSRFLDCASCGARLHAVAHSGFYDEWFLYCDRCPIHAEVSYYAAEAKSIHELPAEQRWAALEARLKPCTCGGTFRFDSPRRCYACSAVVLPSPCHDDLWPSLFPEVDSGERDPEPEEEATMQELLRRDSRNSDLWR